MGSVRTQCHRRHSSTPRHQAKSLSTTCCPYPRSLYGASTIKIQSLEQLADDEYTADLRITTKELFALIEMGLNFGLSVGVLNIQPPDDEEMEMLIVHPEPEQKQ